MQTSSPSWRRYTLVAFAGAAAMLTLMCARSRDGAENAEFYRALFGGAVGGKDGGDIVAEMDGFILTSDHFLSLYNNLPEASRHAMAPEEFLEKYLSQKALYFDAIDNNFHANPELRARLELAWNDIFSVHYYSIRQMMGVTEEAMRTYYDEHRETFTRSERVRVRHIVASPEKESALFNTLKDDVVGDAEARKKIDRLAQRLKAGEDFDALARQYSEDRSAQGGGDIGFLRRGQVDAEFENAAFALGKSGDRTGAIKTKFGWHLIELLDREEGGYLTYAESKPQIMAALEPPQNPEARDKYMAETLQSLKQRYNVRIHKDKIPKP